MCMVPPRPPPSPELRRQLGRPRLGHGAERQEHAHHAPLDEQRVLRERVREPLASPLRRLRREPERRRQRPEPQQRSEEHTSELQSRLHLVCRLLLEKKKTK